MNVANRIQSSHINNSEIIKNQEINQRFVEAVNYLLDACIVVSKADLADKLGIKPSKLSEIMNYIMNI